MRALFVVVALMVSVVPRPAMAEKGGDITAKWLDDLTDRVIADLAAGKPLVVEVHVPLCDNPIIRCGNPKLGDGDNPETNLYWSTTPGFGEWFSHHDWKRAVKLGPGDTGDRDVL